MRFFTTGTVVTLLCLVVSTFSAPVNTDNIPQGTYVIVNRVLCPDGEKLAITFNGQNKAATLTPKSDSDIQRWVVKNYGTTNTMSISPAKATDLQAAWGDDNSVTVLPAHNYVWNIKRTNTGYTIQDGGQTVYWGTENAVANATVTLEIGMAGDEEQRWIFYKVA